MTSGSCVLGSLAALFFKNRKVRISKANLEATAPMFRSCEAYLSRDNLWTKLPAGPPKPFAFMGSLRAAKCRQLQRSEKSRSNCQFDGMSSLAIRPRYHRHQR